MTDSIKHGRIVVLDGWRGLAVAIVIVGHFIIPGFHIGRAGVELFFVLSGRLMADILFVQKSPLGHFFVRRFSRVWPALFVFAVVIFIIGKFIPLYNFGWRPFLSVITFTANYFFILADRVPPLGHIWSLCIEEHSYVFLGLLAFVVRRSRISVIAVLSTALAFTWGNGVFQTLMGGGYYDVYWRSDVRASSIFTSALLFLLLRDRPIPSKWRARCSPICLGLGLFLMLGFVPDPISYTIGSALLALGVCTVEHADQRFQAALSHPLMLRAGLWSYSIYLWQQPFHTLRSELPFVVWPLLSIPAVLAGVASFYYVEQPARRFLNTTFTRKAKAEAVSA